MCETSEREISFARQGVVQRAVLLQSGGDRVFHHDFTISSITIATATTITTKKLAHFSTSQQFKLIIEKVRQGNFSV